MKDSKEKFERNHEDTIRAVQMEWVPKVKHAQEILSGLNGQKPQQSTGAAPSEDEPEEPAKPVKEEIRPATSGDNVKEDKVDSEAKAADEGKEAVSPVMAHRGKMVPLWAFLLMSGAFVCMAVAWIISLI
jgi:hypothetical protein